MEEADLGYSIHVGLLWRRQLQVMLSILVSDAAAAFWLNTSLFLGPAMSSRAKCALTAASCEVLLKAHVRSIDGQFLNQDVEVVITNYLPPS